MAEPMRAVDLAQFTELRPLVAQDVFANLDVALNAVLPGSDTHERYARTEEVGLAAVVGRDFVGRSYTPFDPLTPDMLSFNVSNKLVHPEAWRPKETDEEILGGSVPEELGRFTAYAMAKINALAAGRNRTNYDHLGRISIAPGMIGIAGGQRRLGSLLGISGLWEVHDHLAGSVLADEMVRAAGGDGSLRTADDIAADIEPIFADVKSLHDGVPAAELSREQVGRLLKIVDGSMAQWLPGSAKSSLIVLPDGA